MQPKERDSVTSPTEKRETRGQSLAEFALILPILLVITFGIIDFGRVVFTYALGASALRDGVRYANILGYSGNTPGYQDCDAIQGELSTGLAGVFLGIDDTNADTRVQVLYYQVDDLTGFDASNPDPVSTLNPVADCDPGTATPLPTDGSIPDFENGDILRIEIVNTDITFLTPFLNAFGPLELDFVGQRSIVTRLEFSTDPNDADYDGLNDKWEEDQYTHKECYTGADEGVTGKQIELEDGTKFDCPPLDNDGCELTCEAFHDANPFDPDTDNDGLSDGEEAYQASTSLKDSDTDNDGRTDAEEFFGYQPGAVSDDPNNSGPRYAPRDIITLTINGLPQTFERDNDTGLRTNPLVWDTDGDGYGDGQELGPGNRSETPTRGDSTIEGEIFVNGQLREYTFLLNPAEADSDGDGWNDNLELLGKDEESGQAQTFTITVDGRTRVLEELKTDPRTRDTDGDFLWDNDPNDPTMTELYHNADPTDRDTDDDQYPDGLEVRGIHPTATGGNINNDPPFPSGAYETTLTINGQPYPLLSSELTGGTVYLRPNRSDSDSDGLLDGFELLTNSNHGSYPQPGKTYATNPVDPDTDGDGEDGVLLAYGFDPADIQLVFTDGAESERDVYITEMGSLEDFSSNPTTRQSDDDDSSGSIDGLDPTQPGDDMPPEADRITQPFDMPDSFEYISFRTNPGKGDTDGDGLSDWQETFLYCSYDVNGDGSDIIETDPRDPNKPFPGGTGNEADLTRCDDDTTENGDSDNDGLPDWWEREHFGDLDEDGEGDYDSDGCDNLCEWQNRINPDNPDTDGDMLSDGDELFVYNTLPDNMDSDNDGLNDNIEVLPGGSETNPLDPDSDNDGLTDGQEYNGIDGYTYGAENGIVFGPVDLLGMGETGTLEAGAVRLDPNNRDSDGDGYFDGEEVGPLASINEIPLQGIQVRRIQVEVDQGLTPFFTVTLRPDMADTDGDAVDRNGDGIKERLTDSDEARYGTYPHNPDTDGDTLLDNEELFAERVRTEADNPDTDGDGVNDGDEVKGFTESFNINGSASDVTFEPWEDVIDNNLLPGINPNNPDTDVDGIPDGVELQRAGVSYEIDDPNSDGTITYSFKTYPHIIDSDEDCLTDYEEGVRDGTDPTDIADFSGTGCGNDDVTNSPPKVQIEQKLNDSLNCSTRDQLPVTCTFSASYNDTDGDSIAVYEWIMLDNPGGQFTTDTDIREVIYEFPAYGEFTIQLRARDDNPTDPLWSQEVTYTFILNDNNPPKAQILFDVNTNCGDLTTTPITCTFLDISSDQDGDDIVAWEWGVQNNPGQFISAPTDQNLEYEFPDYGTYTVEFRVTDNDPDAPLQSALETLEFTLSEPDPDPDGDWMTTEDENTIYTTDPNVSQLAEIQNTYTQAGFDAAIEQYLTDGTLIANITDYTLIDGQEVRITVVSISDPAVANNEGQWGDHLTNQYGMSGTTTFRINNNPKIYSATGYVSMQELVFITLEDLNEAPNPQFDYIEWAP